MWPTEIVGVRVELIRGTRRAARFPSGVVRLPRVARVHVITKPLAHKHVLVVIALFQAPPDRAVASRVVQLGTRIGWITLRCVVRAMKREERCEVVNHVCVCVCMSACACACVCEMSAFGCQHHLASDSPPTLSRSITYDHLRFRCRCSSPQTQRPQASYALSCRASADGVCSGGGAQSTHQCCSHKSVHRAQTDSGGGEQCLM